MNLTPFEADYARKESGLREYQDKRMRKGVCAACLKLRNEHSGTGCRFQRMSDREWADYCGVEYGVAAGETAREVQLRRIVETKPGTFAGQFYFTLECRHQEYRLLNGAAPQMPRTLRCATCAKTQKGEGMAFWQNGRDRDHSPNGRPGAGADTPAPVTAMHRTAEVPATVPAATRNGIAFKRAVKRAAKGRVALIGPAGSGKSYTMLVLARMLAGPHGRIAAIDTEHGSLSKYADVFDFDVIELGSYTPTVFVEALHVAEDEGYDVFCCDSLSHFWVGRDGALEFVDMAAKRHKDNQGGWKEFRPHERAMVDDMVASSCHVICTMRTKTEYQEQTDEKGKKKRVKIGLAPVQRDGLEYEFDLVGYMDEENTFITDKTRCSAYSQKAYTKPGPKEFAPFVEWLQGADREERPERMEPANDTGGHALGTRAAAQHVAEQKIAAGSPASQATWKTMKDCELSFAMKREQIGEVQWRGVLEGYGWKSWADIKKALDSSKDKAAARRDVAACWQKLDAIAREVA